MTDDAYDRRIIHDLLTTCKQMPDPRNGTPSYLVSAATMDAVLERVDRLGVSGQPDGMTVLNSVVRLARRIEGTAVTTNEKIPLVPGEMGGMVYVKDKIAAMERDARVILELTGDRGTKPEPEVSTKELATRIKTEAFGMVGSLTHGKHRSGQSMIEAFDRIGKLAQQIEGQES